jgi:hypothetical protein
VNILPTYQLTLRALGQVLDLLHVHAFEIEVDGKDLVVHGVSEKTERKVAIKAMGFGNLVKIFRPTGVTVPGPQTGKKAPRSFTFSGMRFTETDLDRLEKQGRASRTSVGGTPSCPSLAQVLRAVGAYIDHKRARLVRVSGRDNRLAIIYHPPLGEQKLETFTQTELYDLWVLMYRRRRPAISFATQSNRRIA